jgi:Tol biopolymer transport system component
VWSPDGTTLAFESESGGNRDILSINVDGTGLRVLAAGPGRESSPSGAPDGSRITFEGPGEDGTDIFVMNADGTAVTDVTNVAGNDSAPAWSRSGAQIAFISDRDGNVELYVMNADGRAGPPDERYWWRARTGLETGGVACATSFRWCSCVWALVSCGGSDGPLAANLTFLQRANGEFDIRLPTKIVRPLDLTRNLPADSFPTWSPDGTRIAFTGPELQHFQS